MVNSLAAGAISGLTSCILLQPLDVIKTRLQEPSNLPKNYSAVLQRIYQTSGPKGFWRGLSPTLWRNVPGTGLYLLMINQLKYLTILAAIRWPDLPNPFVIRLNKGKQDGQSIQHSVFGLSCIGAFSRTSLGFVFMPLTVLKTRIESSQYRYSSLWQGALEIRRIEGIRGLFRGFLLTMSKELPYSAIFLPLYQKYKTLFSLSTARPTESGFVKFPSAFLAGATATAITQPFDMVRSRIQLKPVEYKSFFQASSKIISQEGFLVLFTGAFPRVARKSLQSAITWTTFELLLKT